MVYKRKFPNMDQFHYQYLSQTNNKGNIAVRKWTVFRNVAVILSNCALLDFWSCFNSFFATLSNIWQSGSIKVWSHIIFRFPVILNRDVSSMSLAVQISPSFKVGAITFRSSLCLVACRFVFLFEDRCLFCFFILDFLFIEAKPTLNILLFLSSSSSRSEWIALSFTSNALVIVSTFSS